MKRQQVIGNTLLIWSTRGLKVNFRMKTLNKCGWCGELNEAAFCNAAHYRSYAIKAGTYGRKVGR